MKTAILDTISNFLDTHPDLQNVKIRCIQSEENNLTVAIDNRLFHVHAQELDTPFMPGDRAIITETPYSLPHLANGRVGEVRTVRPDLVGLKMPEDSMIWYFRSDEVKKEGQ